MTNYSEGVVGATDHCVSSLNYHFKVMKQLAVVTGEQRQCVWLNGRHLGGQSRYCHRQSRSQEKWMSDLGFLAATVPAEVQLWTSNQITCKTICPPLVHSAKSHHGLPHTALPDGIQSRAEGTTATQSLKAEIQLLHQKTKKQKNSQTLNFY